MHLIIVRYIIVFYQHWKLVFFYQQVCLTLRSGHDIKLLTRIKKLKIQHFHMIKNLDYHVV